MQDVTTTILDTPEDEDDPLEGTCLLCGQTEELVWLWARNVRRLLTPAIGRHTAPPNVCQYCYRRLSMEKPYLIP